MAIIKEFIHDGKNYALQETITYRKNHKIVLGEYDEQDIRTVKSDYRVPFILGLIPYFIILIPLAIVAVVLAVNSAQSALGAIAIVSSFLFVIVVFSAIISQFQLMNDFEIGFAAEKFIVTLYKEGITYEVLSACENKVMLLFEWERFFDRSTLHDTPLINYLKQLDSDELDQILVDSVAFKTKMTKLETLRASVAHSCGNEVLWQDAQKSIHELGAEISQLELQRRKNTDKLMNYLNNNKMLNALAS